MGSTTQATNQNGSILNPGHISSMPGMAGTISNFFGGIGNNLAHPSGTPNTVSLPAGTGAANYASRGYSYNSPKIAAIVPAVSTPSIAINNDEELPLPKKDEVGTKGATPIPPFIARGGEGQTFSVPQALVGAGKYYSQGKFGEATGSNSDGMNDKTEVAKSEYELGTQPKQINYGNVLSRMKVTPYQAQLATVKQRIADIRARASQGNSKPSDQRDFDIANSQLADLQNMGESYGRQ